MPINYNASGSLKTVSDVKINVGGTLHQVIEVWENVNGTLKLVWPGSHTAYDGTNFWGVLGSGVVWGTNITKPTLVSGLTETANGAGLQRYYYSSESNGNMTSGTMEVKSSSTGTDVAYNFLGYRSKYLIDMSRYSSITVHVSKIEATRSDLHYVGVSFLNSSSALISTVLSGTYPSVDSDITFNVSSITGLCYVLFVMRLNLRSSSSSQSKVCHYKFTKIAFS